jgi:hypothetical protein
MMWMAGKSLNAGSLARVLGAEVRRRALLWALLASLVLHLALLLITLGAPSGAARLPSRVVAPSMQISLLPAEAVLVNDSPAWYVPSFDLPLLPDYGQALQQLADSQLNWPASAVAVADTEAELLTEPSFVPSDFSRAQVNLQLELEIDETGLVRQIRVLSGHLSEAEYAPIFAKLALLQYRPAIQQGRGVASTKIYTVTYSAPSSD